MSIAYSASIDGRSVDGSQHAESSLLSRVGKTDGLVTSNEIGMVLEIGVLLPAINWWVIASSDGAALVVGASISIIASHVLVDTSDGGLASVDGACVEVVTNGGSIEWDVLACSSGIA